MKTSTQKDIALYIVQHEPISATQIARHFGISNEMTHRHLKKLIEKGHIIKKGTPPKVYYFMNPAQQREYDLLEKIHDKKNDLISRQFLYIDPSGYTIHGPNGFIQRCDERNLDVSKSYDAFHEIIKQINKQRDSLGLIDVHKRFKKQFDKNYLDGLWIVDVNQLKQFGRSKLAQLAFYSKQLQRYDLIQQVIELTNNQIHAFIQKHKIDGICYAPPTINRPKHQFMDEIRRAYNVRLPEIKLTKIFGDIRIPQKSISSRQKRLANAEQTIYIVGPQPKAKRLLIIDDFIGSGATINICAKKIRQKGLADKIYGISLLGNIDFKYDVINEV